MKSGTSTLHEGAHVVWVGWLGKKVTHRGTVPSAIMQVLRHHRDHSYVEDYELGCHTCEICDHGEFHGEFVIQVGSTHYVLPVGIFHYIEEHGYCPPDKFLKAIQPPNKSPEPTAVGAVSSASRFTVFCRRWLSFFR